MRKPKTARKQKPRKTSSRFKGWWKRPDLSATMKARWADPEYREKMRLINVKREEDRKVNPEKYNRTGIPDGMRKRHYVRMKAKVERAADRFIDMLKTEGDLPQVPDTEAGMAEAALKEAFVMAVMPGDKKIKMAAINTVLNFTKAKPESKSKVTVSTAEDWLKAAKAEMTENDD